MCHPLVLTCLILVVVLLIGIHFILPNPTDKPAFEKMDCKCVESTCGCCVSIDVHEIKIDGTLCSNISYLSDDLGVGVTLAWNDTVILNESVSVKNPPRICPPPIVDIIDHVCLHFYHLDFKNKTFSGCLELEIVLAVIIPLKHIKIGCWGPNADFVRDEFKHFFSHRKIKLLKPFQNILDSTPVLSFVESNIFSVLLVVSIFFIVIFITVYSVNRSFVYKRSNYVSL